MGFIGNKMLNNPVSKHLFDEQYLMNFVLVRSVARNSGSSLQSFRRFSLHPMFAFRLFCDNRCLRKVNVSPWGWICGSALKTWVVSKRAN